MKLSTALSVHRGDVVVFTGAGGKTTAMLRLGNELAAAGWRVIAAPTTRLGLDQLHLFPTVLVDPTSDQISDALTSTPFLLAIQERDEQAGKALGFPPEQIRRFRQHADVVLVEGDGSRGLPLKAPGPGEPVIPTDATHVVTVVGVQALGASLGPATVHRPEIFADLTGLHPDDVITPTSLARLLLHPQGPARGAPDTARRHILLNGCDHVAGAGDEATFLGIQRLATRLAADPDIDTVLLAQVAHEPPVLASYGAAVAIVLAAGAARRFGSPKQLLDWQGTPLLRHVAAQALAAPVRDVFVVLGAYFEEIASILRGLPITLVYNPDWETGQSTSMKAGLRACPPDTQAALFVLGDQPHLPAVLLSDLVETHRRTRAAIIAPRVEGRRGNPVLFDRRCFADLYEISGDAGGRSLFQQHADEIQWVDTGPEILHDIDTPEEATPP